jgi:hypothetical protein
MCYAFREYEPIVTSGVGIAQILRHSVKENVHATHTFSMKCQSDILEWFSLPSATAHQTFRTSWMLQLMRFVFHLYLTIIQTSDILVASSNAAKDFAMFSFHLNFSYMKSCRIDWCMYQLKDRATDRRLFSRGVCFVSKPVGPWKPPLNIFFSPSFFLAC